MGEKYIPLSQGGHSGSLYTPWYGGLYRRSPGLLDKFPVEDILGALNLRSSELLLITTCANSPKQTDLGG